MLRPISEIKANLGIEPNGRVQRAFTDECANRMDKYIPADQYILRKSARKQADSVTYQSSYAHAQYVGVVNGSPVRNYTTPRDRTLLG